MQIWDCIILIFSIITLFFVPLNISFDLYLDLSRKLTLKFMLIYCPFFLYLIDILVKMNRGYFDKGTMILNKRGIIKNYLMNQFFVDFITLIASFTISNYFNLIFLIKLFSVIRSIKSFDENIDLSEKKQGLF